MKTSNIGQGRAHQEAIIRGWVSRDRAGSTGITVGDGTTSGDGITGITVDGGTVVDNGDGTVTITIGSGLGWFVVTAYGATGDGTTDDTAAIQATIDAATAAGGGVVYFPPGHYIISGVLQDTGDFNGQILLPELSVSTDAQVTIHFKGALKPEFAIHGPFPSTAAYSIIESTLTGASGTAAVFSGGNGSYPTQNNVQVIVEDLICLAPTNPTFTFWNLSTCQGGSVHNVLVWLSAWANPATSPTHSNAYGMKLPQWSESNYTHVDGLMVACFYTGLLQGELAICRGLVFGLNVVALELPTSKHSSLIVDMHQTGCTYGIRATGTHACDILQFSTEHYTSPPLPAWTVTVYDLDDASNYMLGYIRWYALDGVSITPDHIFNVNGGANVEHSEVGEPWSSGGSPTGAAGGDLSGTYPNPSVVDDSHSHTAATLPAATASSVDHEHLMNLWFSGDGATTAFELPAAAFDSQSIRVWVSGTLTDVTLSGAMLTTMTFGAAPASATNNIVVDLVAAAA